MIGIVDRLCLCEPPGWARTVLVRPPHLHASVFVDWRPQIGDLSFQSTHDGSCTRIVTEHAADTPVVIRRVSGLNELLRISGAHGRISFLEFPSRVSISPSLPRRRQCKLLGNDKRCNKRCTDGTASCIYMSAGGNTRYEFA